MIFPVFRNPKTAGAFLLPFIGPDQAVYSDVSSLPPKKKAPHREPNRRGNHEIITKKNLRYMT